MKFLKISIFLLLPLGGYAQSGVLDIAALGAKADGKTNNAVIIQKAIDQASGAGGGTVNVPAGKFMTGPLLLKTGVNLHLDQGAVLLATPNRLDYGAGYAVPLISADQQKNISITGKGTIDGNGKKLLADLFRLLKKGVINDTKWQTYNPWHQKQPEEPNRPRMLLFTHCKDIALKNVKFIDGTDWIQDFKFCENLTVDSISVISNLYWNNDGIDVVDCKNVKITNSFFDCDDDAICLKSENRSYYCENVYVANCKVRSSASGIKFGTASRGGFKNVTIKDVYVYDTYRSAIALEAVDGGFLEDIDIRNITAVNTGNAIFIRLGHRNQDEVMSRVKNIYIADIKVQVPGGKPDKGYPMEGPIVREPHHLQPCVIAGLPGYPVQNVTLERISVSYAGKYNNRIPTLTADSLDRVPERPSDYPEFSMFGDLPAWALYVRHAENLTLKDVTFTHENTDKRAALVFQDVNKLTVEGLTLPASTTIPAIITKDVRNFKTNSLKLPAAESRAILNVSNTK